MVPEKQSSRWFVRLVRGTWYTALVLFLLALFTSLALLFPVVQTWLAGVASSYVHDRWGVDLRIERVALRPFGPVRLRGVLLLDLHGDTLIAAEDLRVAGLRPSLRSHDLHARMLRLDNARFRLVKAAGDTTSNLTQLMEKFGTSEGDTSAAAWTIACRNIQVNGLRFTYDNGNEQHTDHGVDVEHVNVIRADLHALDFRAAGDSVTMRLERLAIREGSGFDLGSLSGDAMVSGRGIRIGDMRLRTPGSTLNGALAFTTDSWRSYDEFYEQVHMRLDLDSSRLQFADVALFATALDGVDLPMDVSGRFRGTVNELKGRDMHLAWGQHSSFDGDADLSGLPYQEALFMVIDANELRTDPADLAALPTPPFTGGGHMELPVEVERLGPLVFRGNFTGFLNEFTTLGRTTTALGTVRTDMTFDRDRNSGNFHMKGRVVTDGFELGQLLADRTLGPLACDVRLNAEGRDLAHMKAGIEGSVPLITVNGYRVTRIDVKGELRKDRFNGELTCRDPQLDMDFKGLADMSRRLPRGKGRIYEVDFTANIRHADLHALNLVERAGWNSLQTTVRARGEVAPDSLKGIIHFDDLWYCDGGGDRLLGSATLESSRENGRPRLDLRSDPIDVTVHGDLLPTRLGPAVRSVIFSVFPALSEQVSFAQADQQFTFDLTVKDPAPLLDLLGTDMILDKGAHASGSFDSRTFDLSLDAWVPHLAWRGFNGDSVRVVADKTMDVLAFSFRSARQHLNDSTWIGGIDITGKAYQDEVELRTGWSASSQGTEGDLEIQALVNGPRSIEATLLPSQLWFGRGFWKNEGPAHLRWDSTLVKVDGLELTNDGQRILLDGAIGAAHDDALAFELENVRMENLDPWVGQPSLHGSVSGDGRLFALLAKPYLLSYLCVDSLAIGSEAVGDLKLSAAWNETARAIDLNGNVTRDSIPSLGFSGSYTPEKDNALDLKLSLDHFDLAFLNTYLPGDLTGIQGKVTGAIDLSGSIDAPHIAGSAMVDDAGLRIDYLNTSYRFSHRVDIVDDMITMDNVRAVDQEGNTVKLGCTVIHQGFSHWNYDVWGELDHALCLNTTVNDNSLFYGKAYGTGTFEVSGFGDKLDVTVDARSEKGSRIALPLGGSTEVGAIDFVRFISSSADTSQQQGELDLSGVSLDMNVEVDPETRFELIFDPTVGDVLSGSGSGRLRMQVTPSGEFTMRGKIDVVQGDYLFTLRNVVNKRFVLLPGGSITWYGDPFSATLDMRAAYRVRAPLYDIMRDKIDAYKQRVPVDVIMDLSDKLMNPVIDFEVQLPSVDDNVRTEVASALNTEQELNRQVFALIMLNRFLAPPDQASSGANGFTQSGFTTSTELLSNQFSNWLSRLSDDFDLGVNWRPGDALTKDEYDVMVSTQLFENRLILTTNVGVQGGSRTSASNNNFVGDFTVEYLLTREGRWRAKAYSLSNDRNLNQVDKALYTQGIGLAYRREFNSIGELFRRKVKPSKVKNGE